jgi:hypothetical protein
MPRDVDFKQALCANVDCFRLHAAVRYGADEHPGPEQLCRHITRRALANEPVQCNAAGQVVLKPNAPWCDGTTHLVMSALEFMHRQAALIPRPAALRRPIQGIECLERVVARWPRRRVRRPLTAALRIFVEQTPVVHFWPISSSHDRAHRMPRSSRTACTANDSTRPKQGSRRASNDFDDPSAGTLIPRATHMQPLWRWSAGAELAHTQACPPSPATRECAGIRSARAQTCPKSALRCGV